MALERVNHLSTDDSIRDLTRQVAGFTDAIRSKAYSGYEPSSKASAILAGAAYDHSDSGGESFLYHVAEARRGSPDSNAYVKSILGTSTITGQAIIPRNFVDQMVEIEAALSPWRNIITFESGIGGLGVDIPYDLTGIGAALVQGSKGSNKDNRDFSFGSATATMYTIAQITDVSSQLLRQSAGAAESIVRRRLAKSFALTESAWIINGTGSGQPLGILQALLAYGDVAAFKTTLSSEPRLATIGRALGALEARGEQATAVVMNPGDYWESAVEGLGTAYAGGWAADPVGAASGRPVGTAWGVPIYRDASLPSGTALAGNFAAMSAYIGAEYRVDVSSEAGDRFDKNLVGYRAEMDFGWTAEPYIYTGMVQKILGL